MFSVGDPLPARPAVGARADHQSPCAAIRPAVPLPVPDDVGRVVGLKSIQGSTSLFRKFVPDRPSTLSVVQAANEPVAPDTCTSGPGVKFAAETPTANDERQKRRSR